MGERIEHFGGEGLGLIARKDGHAIERRRQQEGEWDR
jgi:hypothetical protein